MIQDERRDDQTLRRYLLGELAELEAERLESELITDDELFDLAEAVEADLLEAAARGELSSAERDQVVRRLAASAAGRSRLALAQGLATVAREGAVVVPFRPRFATASPAWRTAAAAAGVALVVGSCWLALRDLGSPKPGEHVATGGAEIAPPPAPSPAPAPPAPTVPAAPPEVRAAVPSPPPALEPMVFMLAVTPLRGPGETEPLVAPADADIELRFDVTEEEPFTKFQVTVSARGQRLARERSAARDDDGVRTVSITLPADRLPSGFYQVTVEGLTDDKPALLGHQEIEVVRR